MYDFVMLFLKKKVIICMYGSFELIINRNHLEIDFYFTSVNLRTKIINMF